MLFLSNLLLNVVFVNFHLLSYAYKTFHTPRAKCLLL